MSPLCSIGGDFRFGDDAAVRVVRRDEFYNLIRKVAHSGKVDDMAFAVWGTSMVPTIKPGDTIRAKLGFPSDGIRVGDIILYHKFPDHYTVHRVVRVSSHNGAQSYFTKGDNCSREDDYSVSAAEVVGLVVLVER